MNSDPSSPPSHSQWGLLRTRRFGPFFATQFLGAFNDNLFKNGLVVLLTFHAASWTTLSPEVLTNLAAAIFILPFFVFSATAGQLADKYDKARLARLVKVLEVVIMSLAAAGFFTQSLNLLLSALFLLGLHSTLFGPVKYAILPQHLGANELVGGNALVEAGTFVAILVGTIAGGLIAGVGGHPGWIAAAGLSVAAAGLTASVKIPSAPAPVPELKVNLNPFVETWNNIGFARRKRTVFLAILGISWFWLYGALFLAQFPVFTKRILGGDETVVTLLLAMFTIGIGAGSMLCTRLSGKRVELGLVPLGAIGLSLFAFDLVAASPSAPTALASGAPLSVSGFLALASTWRILFDLCAIGVFGGFFTVPLYVIMQTRSAVRQRARVIAANNILNALFMVVGAIVAAALLALGFTIPTLFGIAAFCNLLIAAYIYRLMPVFLLRLAASALIHSIYRIEKRGFEHIPEDRPAVIVCNHISFIDAVVVFAVVQRPIRFVIDHAIYRIPVLNIFFRQLRTIPIAPTREDPGQKEFAFKIIAQGLKRGELIVLFPEGGISADGTVKLFRHGIERVIADTPVPVIPMALRGLWGSFFSRRHGPAMSKPLKIRLRRSVDVHVGPAVAPELVSSDYLRDLVSELRGDKW
jgi:1-acyl-sn-glycerol-3-phosphate acyltransferase